VKFSIAGARSEDKTSLTFELPQLGHSGKVVCFADAHDLAECSIEYDAHEKIDIPVKLLLWMYNIPATKSAFTLPIRWNFEKSCEIVVRFKCKPSTTVLLHYFPYSKDVVPMFRASQVFQLERQQLFEFNSDPEDKAVIVFQNCRNIQVYHVNRKQDLDAEFAESFEMELNLFRRKCQIFMYSLRSEEQYGNFQIFSYEKYNLQVKVSTKREVWLAFDKAEVFEDNVQHLPIWTSPPEWRGQKVVYHWSSDFVGLLERARSFTHLQLPRMLTSVQKAQMACILGMSVEKLDELMLEKFSQETAATHFTLLCEK
jgi:hypothetical protein